MMLFLAFCVCLCFGLQKEIKDNFEEEKVRVNSLANITINLIVIP